MFDVTARGCVETGGCPWDENVALRSAAVGRVDILSWALERGCPLPRGRRGALEMMDNLPLSDEQRSELAGALGVENRADDDDAAAADDDDDAAAYTLDVELVVESD